MNIWGYGESFTEATADLNHHVKMHLAYLARTKQSDKYYRPAAAAFQKMHRECVAAKIRNEETPGWWVTTVHISAPTAFHADVLDRTSYMIRATSNECHSLLSFN